EGGLEGVRARLRNGVHPAHLYVVDVEVPEPRLAFPCAPALDAKAFGKSRGKGPLHAIAGALPPTSVAQAGPRQAVDDVAARVGEIPGDVRLPGDGDDTICKLDEAVLDAHLLVFVRGDGDRVRAREGMTAIRRTGTER